MRSLPSVASALTLSLGISSIAFAQDSSASDIALARTLGLEGVSLADSGNCAAAIEKLQRAESLYHAPTILVRLGECQVATGKIVAGTENLQRVVREKLPTKAPKPFVDAQVRAQKVLTSALPKLAKLKIHVDAPPGAAPVVKLDGDAVSAASLDADRPADPGPHHLEASAPGFRVATADTTLQEGSTGAVTLKLEADLGAPPPAMGPAPYPPYGPVAGPPMPPQPGQPPMGPPQQNPPPGMTMAPMAPPPAGAEVSTGSGSKTAGFVLIGIGAAGVAAGSIFGAVALSKRSALDTSCTSGKDQCPANAQSDIDGMKGAATGSTIGFGVGGAGLVIGLIVLLSSKKTTTADAEHPAPRASIDPMVGPGSVGLTGSF